MNKVFLIIGMSFIFLFVGFSAVDIAESNDVIYACKHKDEGMVRIVDDHSYCRPSEETVTLLSGQDIESLIGCPCWDTELLNQIASYMVPVGAGGTVDSCIDSETRVQYGHRHPETGTNGLTFSVGFYRTLETNDSLEFDRSSCISGTTNSHVSFSEQYDDGVFITPCDGLTVEFGCSESRRLITRRQSQACAKMLRDSDIWARCNN